MVTVVANKLNESGSAKEPELIIFYDGLCPLCAKEMAHLSRLDEQERIHLIDINDESYLKNHGDIDSVKAMKVLHGKLPTGEVILGLDVTYRAWQLVGKGMWIAPLRMPLIKAIADMCYRLFAKHRYAISKLLTGKSRLSECDRCSLDRNNSKPHKPSN